MEARKCINAFLNGLFCLQHNLREEKSYVYALYVKNMEKSWNPFIYLCILHLVVRSDSYTLKYGLKGTKNKYQKYLLSNIC